ncbi:MAG TPA: DUF1501 domain-containing protein, partial [Myxococcota bacterium]|nr:DUF1501 domain-containing protein [Myxococcota bacterium]
RSLMLGGLSLAGGALALPARGAGAWVDALSAFSGDEDQDGEPPVLVVIEMFGGNDGLNTLVPYADDEYYRIRPKLKLDREDLLTLDDEWALNAKLAWLRGKYEEGHAAIVQGVGYPHPVYSHFKSLEIWHTGDLRGRVSGDGWLARLRAAAWPDDPRPELLINVGMDEPYSVFSSTHGILSFEVPEKYLWAGETSDRTAYQEAASTSTAAASMDASGKGGKLEARDQVLSRLYRTLRETQRTSPRVLEAAADYEASVDYPGGRFAGSLKTIAALIEARLGTRIFTTQLAGFDTHAGQVRRHREMLAEVDNGLSAFFADLAGRSTAKNVVVAVVSEFGRRAAENESHGTDHGAAGVTFLFGERVKGGLYGKPPSLTDLDADGNLVFTTDFRSIYGTLIQDWFGLPQTAVLSAAYPRVPVFEA